MSVVNYSIKKSGFRFIAFWSPILYLLITTTRLTYFWETRESAFNQNLEDGNIFISSIGIFVLLLIIPGLYKNRDQYLSIIKLIWPLLLLFLFALLSCAWSSVPFMSFRRWLKLFIILLCLLNCFFEDNTGKLLKNSVFSFLSISLYISLFFIIFLPQFSWHEYQDYLLPCGILSQKNSLGQLSAITCLIGCSFLTSCKSQRIFLFYLIPVIISFILLIISQAMAAVAGFFISIILVVSITSILKLNILKLCISVLLFCIYLIFIFLIFNLGNNCQLFLSDLLSLFGKDMTFTGRSDMWNILFQLGLNSHPLLGSGYGSFFLGEKSSWILTYIDWEATHAHNGFLMIFLELGIIGFCLICIFLFSVAISFLKKHLNSLAENLSLIATFIFIICNNFFESELMATSIVFSTLIFLSIFSNRSIFNESRLLACL